MLHRSGDLHAVVADVALLLVDYFLRVRLRGRSIINITTGRVSAWLKLAGAAAVARRRERRPRLAPLPCTQRATLATRPCPPDPGSQVALRGGVEVRREVHGTRGRRPFPGMQAMVLDAVDRVPAAAAAVLLHMGAPSSGACLVDLQGWRGALLLHMLPPLGFAGLAGRQGAAAGRPLRGTSAGCHRAGCTVDTPQLAQPPPSQAPLLELTVKRRRCGRPRPAAAPQRRGRPASAPTACWRCTPRSWRESAWATWPSWRPTA